MLSTSTVRSSSPGLPAALRVAASSTNSGIVGPTYPSRPVDDFEQLNSADVKAAIQNQVVAFLHTDHAAALQAPAYFEHFASVDVTPRYERNSNYVAFNVNGELMLEIVPHGDTKKLPAWYDIGRLDETLQAAAAA